MADIAVSTLVLLSDTLVKNVFEAILKNRSAIFKELITATGKKADDPDDRRVVEDAVARLKDAALIKECPASIEDFNSYYVTSDGLGAERQLRLAEKPKKSAF